MASRDFLRVFGGGEKAQPEGVGSAAEGESDEIELGLGLCLGSRFGTDRSPDAKRPRLLRSTSIASTCSVSAGDGDGDPSPASPLQLLRTSSLPMDTEEERWRRREMQSRRRLEARRKMLGRRSSMGSSSGPCKPDKEDGDDVVNGLQLKRSTGSQGSSSSANPQEQGAQFTDARSSTSEYTDQNNVLPLSVTRAAERAGAEQQPPLRTLGSLTMRTNSSSDMRKSMMEDMPMVSSKVEGPDGKKIDGFLYRYRKGGEGVRIVCVCHGNFLTPAEFVKHAGGGDVSNPLRHIVVNPSPSAFMSLCCNFLIYDPVLVYGIPVSAIRV
ncbi:hypothetical protein BRADI_1g59982v3 [Brachypodium distachyon]|uniref:Ninja-family protein n=2 Tax=Brachypodium distachyon TaxID=15368 RepID=A0A2K2DSJ2_BRADI|nr:hypothetical protein BRADI_1g59982v3 [Brachypodium distachyon]